MLVARWGILRRALPAAMGLKKQIALTMCLCRLHNYCITERLLNKQDISQDIVPSLAVDAVEISAYGGIRMEKNNEGWNDFSPNELLGSGHHFEDLARSQYRRRTNVITPRDHLFAMVVQQGLKRPTPKQWKI